MTKEKMTVHKALAELKVLDNRIISAVSDVVGCVANKASNNKIKGVSVEDYCKVMTGYYDKASDLIARRGAIKKAVSLSNARTMVNVAGKEYCIAEAIEMKNNGLKYKKHLLEVLKRQYATATTKIEKENSTIDEKADNYVIGLYGTSDKKVANDEVEKAKKAFIAHNQYVLVDPLKVLEKINMLEAQISEFEAEVDAAISVSNAITEIEFEY